MRAVVQVDVEGPGPIECVVEVDPGRTRVTLTFTARGVRVVATLGWRQAWEFVDGIRAVLDAARRESTDEGADFDGEVRDADGRARAGGA